MDASNGSYRLSLEKLSKQWRDPNISRSAKAIFLDLVLYAGSDGKVYPSQETLANNQNLSIRQVNNLLRELRKKNLIEWQSGNGPGNSNLYRINAEIYFHNSPPLRQPASHPPSIGLQSRPGSQLPPNEVNERYKRMRKPKFTACGLGNCNKGYIVPDTPGSVSRCDCRVKYEQDKEAWGASR